MTSPEYNFEQDIQDISQIPAVASMLNVICQTTGMGFAAIARVTDLRWITCSVQDNIGFGLKPGDELDLKTTICNEIRISETPVIINHVAEDPYFSKHHTPAMYGFQSYISVPILLKDGSFFGTICSIDPKPNRVSSPEVIGMFRLFSELISFHLNALQDRRSDKLQLSAERELYRQLAESEERLQIVMEATELGTWEINVLTRAIKYSDRFREILGLPEGIPLTVDDTRKQIPEEDLASREAAFKRAIDTGVFYYSGRIIRPDNNIYWIENKGKTFYNEKKEPTHIVGTIRDITREKTREQVLTESEEKFRLLADSMPQHIWTADPQGNLNYYNRSVYDYSGLSPDELREKGWLDIVHPEDREENVRQWMEAVTTGTSFLLEHRFRRNDGTFRWQLSRALPQKDADGNIRMWVGTSTDIQEQKTFTDELEQKVQERTRQLNENNIALEKMNKELQSFAYISSHDLQEPLRKIQTFATVILQKEHANLSENGKDYFRRMQNAAERMQALINDLLTYSRTDAEDRKFEMTDLNDIVNLVKTDLKEELEQKHATFDASRLCTVPVIPFQFRQLLYNLVSNSIKFARPGVIPHITIKSMIGPAEEFMNDPLKQGKNYCHISISDNGIGFDQKYSEKIFDLFQRLHGKAQYDGTGIGLAIVKKIVDNHHGTISAKSLPGHGATFDIYFPVHEEEAAG